MTEQKKALVDDLFSFVWRKQEAIYFSVTYRQYYND